LGTWIIASDQPFMEAENPEFVDLLNYIHSPAQPLEILGWNTIKHQVTNIGKDGIDEMKAMFVVWQILLLLSYLITFYRKWMVKLWSLWTAGHQAICMHLLSLSHIISMSMESSVCSSIILFVCQLKPFHRRASYRISRAIGGSFRREYGRSGLENSSYLWDRGPGA